MNYPLCYIKVLSEADDSSSSSAKFMNAGSIFVITKVRESRRNGLQIRNTKKYEKSNHTLALCSKLNPAGAVITPTTTSYERAIEFPNGAFTPTSCAFCTMVHKGQQQVKRRSLTNEPSIPLSARILPLICDMNHRFASGTNVTRPHIKQSSPTASAVLPNT